MPADLAAVQADDALLDMIGAGHTVSDTDDELTRVLAAWRREVHAAPVPELVDTSTALATIRAAARQPVRRRNPVFGSAAAAAAVFVIAFSGVGLVAKSAQPGDHLWGVTQVLYSDYARSVETAAAVRTELNEANTALKQNNPERARAALQRVQQQLPVIGEAEGHTDLTARHRQLEQRLLTGSPEPGMGNMSGDPAFPSSVPSGPQPKASEARQSGLPAPGDSTTTPESAKDLGPGTSTQNSDQFMPDRRRYPQGPYPSPGAYPSQGGTPRSGAHDRGTPRNDGRSDDKPSDGSSAGDNTNGGGSPSSPSPSSDGGQVSGGNPGYVGGPHPPGNSFGPVCAHPSPRPPYCG
jgi:anti-sigma-D factor RsdA-like protein